MSVRKTENLITRREAMKRGLLGAAGVTMLDPFGRWVQAAPE